MPLSISTYLGVKRCVHIGAGVVARGALFLVLLLEVCVEGDAHVAEEKEQSNVMEEHLKTSKSYLFSS